MTGKPQSKALDSSARPIPVSDVSWLAPLLDPDGMAEALVNLSRPGADPIDSCEIEHVRYRPGTSCTILYKVGISSPEGPVSLSIYARRIAPGRPPASTTNHSLKPGLEVSGLLLNGPTPLEPGGAVLREFPFDAMIPGLMNLQEPQGLFRSLAAQLSPADSVPTDITGSFVRLRYKPEHRLVLRADLAWWDSDRQTPVERIAQVRFEYGVDWEQRAALISRLATAIPESGLLMAPGPEIHLAQPDCTLVPWREGEDLADRVRRRNPEAATSAGRSLAALGRLEVAGLDRRNLADAIGSSRVQVAMLQSHPPAPRLDVRFTAVLDRLSRFNFDSPLGLVHGDYHQGQLLTRGERVSVLDWDRAHFGDQACDFGRFLAQLELLDLQGKIDGEPMAGAFREAYVTEGGAAPDSAGECFWTVLALVDLALREVRRLRPDWLERVSMILDRCDGILHREQCS